MELFGVWEPESENWFFCHTISLRRSGWWSTPVENQTTPLPSVWVVVGVMPDDRDVLRRRNVAIAAASRHRVSHFIKNPSSFKWVTRQLASSDLRSIALLLGASHPNRVRVLFRVVRKVRMHGA